MSKIITNIILILLLQPEILILTGQESKTYSADESIVLLTDRSIYISGERILFSASLQSYDERDTSHSSIMYCELINSDGVKISGDKFLFSNNRSSGYLNIPDDIITGSYYLRAYTRYMRNYGPEFYHYSGIRILNPYKKDSQTGTVNNPSRKNISNETVPFKELDSLVISTNKNIYAPIDPISLIIDGNKLDLSSFRGFSLSVVPEFSETGSRIVLSKTEFPANNGTFFTENRSLSITGRLFDSISGDPLPLTRINLSILGQGQDFMARETDASGRFVFPLPNYTGQRDLFICAEKIAGVNPDILIDNDFCSMPVLIPASSFALTESERETAFNMAVNVQLESYFRNSLAPDSLNGKSENQAFYGKPDKILDFDKYIQLPSLEDYFNEFPSIARVRKHQGEKYFSIPGDQEGMKVYKPLVLVDLVAIDNPELVLTIQPAEVSRMEIVNHLYLKGGLTYGGILNIISKKGDLARIDLPSSGIFIDYKFLADTVFRPGSYNRSPNEPDTRNTILWEPKLFFNKDLRYERSFSASDTPGSYLIIVSGISLKGEVFRKTLRFVVLEKDS